VGLTLDRIGGEEAVERASEREKMFALNATALNWFHKMLERVPVAKDYVYSRGLAHETIQQFKIGYAPQGWDNLTAYLQGQRLDMKQAAAAGLLQTGKSGDYFDMFRHRIIFPIFDEQERVVGFGGRAFGDDQPKYLNTSETPIFNKSKLLYGLPIARRKISSESRVLLMEGYMDVIAAHQAGFTNAVATLGTSLTKDHAKKLAQLAPAIALVYDGDNAGIKATLRAAEVFKEVQEEGGREVELRMVRLPDGEDPDSVLKRGDIAMFQRAIDGAGSYADFLIDAAKRRQNLNTEEGKSKFLSDLSRVLVDVPSMEACDVYLAEYANLHPYSRYSLQAAVEQMRRELLERKQKLRSRVKKARPVSALVESEQTKSTDFVAPDASRPGERGSSSPITNQTPQPPRIGANSAGQPAKPYRPPLTREERAELERKRFRQSVQPVESTARVMSAEDRAENELVRALLEPEWRPMVLKHISADQYLTSAGRQFAMLVQQGDIGPETGAGEIIRMVEAQNDALFSAAIRDRVQEFQTQMANVPITEEVITKAALSLKRHSKTGRYLELEEELAKLLQKTPLSDSESALVKTLTQERQKLLKELKGST